MDDFTLFLSSSLLTLQVKDRVVVLTEASDLIECKVAWDKIGLWGVWILQDMGRLAWFKLPHLLSASCSMWMMCLGTQGWLVCWAVLSRVAHYCDFDQWGSKYQNFLTLQLWGSFRNTFYACVCERWALSMSVILRQLAL